MYIVSVIITKREGMKIKPRALFAVDVEFVFDQNKAYTTRKIQNLKQTNDDFRTNHVIPS